MKIRRKLGATGLFPEGKLRHDDEGQLRLAIGNRGGKVVLDFGTPTAWIGFNPSDARNLATALNRHADEAERSGHGRG
jgi:hypothetical protein